MFNKCIILLFSIGLSLSLLTCKLINNNESNNTAETIIDPRTRIIETEDWLDKVFMVDSNYTFSMDPTILNDYSLAVGNILLSTVGEGILRKINNIDNSGDRLIVTTSQAAMTEAFEKIHFSFKENLSSRLSQAKIDYLAPGVILKTNQQNDVSVDISISLEIPIDDHFKVSGDLTITPSISGEVDISNYNLNSLRMEFGLHELFELNMSTTLASYELEKEVKVAQFTFPPITVPPVTVVPVFSLYLGANLELESKLSVGVSQELTTTCGIMYSGGNWDPFFSFDPSFGRNGPILSNTATAKAYIKPQIDMKFYGVVSPNLSTQLYGLVEAELGATPWWSLYGGLSADLGIDLSIFIKEITLFNANLFDEKILIASASGTGDDPPMALFDINPDDGTRDTNFRFDASDCLDNVDAVSALLVRWDWEGDGIFDTDFSNAKTKSHKYAEIGTYHPILEVKNTNDLTSQSSKTLIVNLEPNLKPKAMFYISPMTGPSSSPFILDASYSTDPNDSTNALLVQWDFDNDGFYDTYYSYEKKISRTFPIGSHEITLQVKDTGGKTDTETKTLVVFQGNTTGTLIDSRDGRSYKTVKIGNQWWMAENLNYGTQISGDQDMTDNGTVEKYYYDNDPALGGIYGGLYTWGEMMNYQQSGMQVQGIAPDGWHIPSRDEWEIMINHNGGHTTNNAWQYLDANPYYLWQNYKAQRRTNTTGFTALPAGYLCNYDNSRWGGNRGFGAIGIDTFFWSYDVKNDNSFSPYIYQFYVVNRVFSGVCNEVNGQWWPRLSRLGDEDFGYSIRCVKD